MLQQINDSASRISEKAGIQWQQLCAASHLVRMLDILLRSYGQILFADNVVTGFFLITALMMISSSTVLFSLIGIFAASLTAYLLKEEKYFINHGIFGFNGALLGLFWSWYFAVSIYSLIVFICMAVIVVPFHSYLMKKMSLGRFNLPVLSLPSAVVFICSLIVVYWLVYSARLFPSSEVYIINGFLPEPLINMASFGGNDFLEIIFSQQLPAWLLILIGVLLNSRISAFAALLGGLTGYLIINIVPLAAASDYAGNIFIGFNAVPAAMSLFGVFLVANIRSFFFAFAGIAVCAVVWLLLVNIFGLFNFPFLTLPFNFTVLAALTILRKADLRAAGLYPVPLELVTTPENIMRWHQYNVLPRALPAAAGNIIQLLKHPFHLLGPDRRKISEFLDIIASAEKISILSGAGTSTESGIPDFRGNYSFWKQFGAEDFTYDNFLMREDVRVRYWAMERQFYNIILNSKINPIHQTAKWLADQGRLSGIVTQNVDGLFQKAGVDSALVLEIHGTAHGVKCLNCGTAYSRQGMEDIFNAGVYVPCCEKCNGLLKPATVLMGEEVDKILFEKSLKKIIASDLLLVMGTSLLVDPVATLPEIAWQRGVRIVIINATPTPKDHLARLVINYPVGKFFRKILPQLNQ